MKKKVISLVSVVLMAIMICGTQVFAVRETTVVIPGQGWNQRPSVSRTGSYSYGTVQCYAVYPTDGSVDFMHLARVRIANGYSTNQIISNVHTLSETGGAVNIPISEGYQSLRSISFGFSGHSASDGAYIDVYYTGN